MGVLLALALCGLIIARGVFSPRPRPSPAGLAERITQARVFYQPIVWVGQTPPDQADSQSLWTALGVFISLGVEPGIEAIEAFIQSFPDSPWAPALHSNLGKYYLEQGAFSQALDHWAKAWELTKTSPAGLGRKVAEHPDTMAAPFGGFGPDRAFGCRIS
jgi:hypothetical protein